MNGSVISLEGLFLTDQPSTALDGEKYTVVGTDCTCDKSKCTFVGPKCTFDENECKLIESKLILDGISNTFDTR